ncbi:ArsR/SmtB family transcription factor [Muricoccus vinaceus]|uniref:ArsR/SmtB family transcription factor n=1 Tax=Muricoccus vinaceus TaxID=424704 RepID=A0ABV6IVL8_9PROT
MRLDSVEVAEGAALLRVLANPARLGIALHLLNGECSVGQIEEELGVKQPNLSQHLAEMRDAGLLVSRRESRMVFYRVTPGKAEQLLLCLRQGLGGEVPAALPAVQRKPVRNAPASTFAVVRKG